MNPEERVMRARLAAHTLHSRVNGRELTQKARDVFASSFEREVLNAAAERGERLSSGEVARRAEHLRKAHFTRLSMQGVAARRRKNEERAGEPAPSTPTSTDRLSPPQGESFVDSTRAR